MNREFNYKLIFRVIGFLIIIESVFLLLTSVISIIYEENDFSCFILSGTIALSVGLLFAFLGKNPSTVVGKREGSIIVTFTWIFFSLFGLLPFWLSKSIPSFTDAFFETMSGFTTTGSSILNDIESLSHGMLFWRNLTQWIGGLGIIVISMAILPVFGMSSNQMFVAEATGPTKEKIHPKISETAKRLFFIYLGLTLTQIIILRVAGMDWFDSVCHSAATIATGGFSTKQSSIAYWDSPLIQYIIIVFMILSGVNFSLYYFGLKRRFDKIRENEELRYYLLIVISFTIIITISQFRFKEAFSFNDLEKMFRDALFTVSSIITSTGFSTQDYMLWRPFVWIMLIILMFTGASAGSTSGGMKMIRVVIAMKACYYEFKRLIHPNAIVPIRYNNHAIKDDIILRVLTFIVLYFAIVGFGTVILSLAGVGFEESISGMVSSLSNIGPGLGKFGPAENFSHTSHFVKWFLSFVMLIGRLELFTVLLLFTPAFWKK